MRPPHELDGRYGNEAQYIPVPSAKYANLYGEDTIHYNLCGHLSLAAIYETVSGETESLGMIWDNYSTAPGDVSGSGGWVATINNLPGWSAEQTYIDWRDPYQEISQILSSGSFIIIGCTLDTKTGRLVPQTLEGTAKRYVGHWATIAYADRNGVWIYNPYTNSYQYYTWRQFKDTDGAAIIVTHKNVQVPELQKVYRPGESNGMTAI